MIVVTGTKRSGTSMWMQILIAAGLPHVGTPFAGTWESSIRDANSLGFFESKFRQGVYFATNPDPDTGAFVRPEHVTRHVVKVFIPGLLRSELAYLGRVVATMRNWREYCASLERLHAMEDTFRASQIASGAQVPERAFPDENVDLIMRAGKLPPALEWWFENYDLIRNVVTRRFPFHMTTYDRLLRDPEAEVAKVLQWIGEGALEPAVAAVRSQMRTQVAVPKSEELVADFAELFDELFDRIDRGRDLDAALITKVNEANVALSARWADVARQRLEAASSGVKTR